MSSLQLRWSSALLRSSPLSAPLWLFLFSEATVRDRLARNGGRKELEESSSPSCATGVTTSRNAKGNVSEAHFKIARELKELGLFGNPLVLDLQPDWIPPFQIQHLNLRSVRMNYLENWASAEREHSSSLAGAIQALEATTVRLPVTIGARADVRTVMEAISSAVDIMQAIEVLFSSLPPFTVQASLRHGSVAVLRAGEDIITVIWGLNGTTHRGVDSQYKKVKHEIIDKPYTQSNKQVSIDWMIKKDVPTATYFVRAYVVDASGKEGAYGQNSVKNKATNLFSVQGISGRHASFDIAAACFSAFAVVSLFGFFYEEKRKAKKSQGSLFLKFKSFNQCPCVEASNNASNLTPVWVAATEGGATTEGGSNVHKEGKMRRK
ncbi:hypothetical protein ACLOJK_003755 [Asimina triloba]